MDDLSLRNEFRRALDVVAPPAPWLAVNVRTALRRHSSDVVRKRRPFALTLSPAASRLLAIALIVVLLVAAAGAFLAIHRFVLQPIPIHPHTGAVMRSCSTGTVDMITTKIGWQGTSRTTDGGTTWRDVSPPALPRSGKGGGYVCVLDGDHAWVTEATSVFNSACAAKGCAGPEIDGIYVMSTVDGGVTWRTSERIPGNGSQSLSTEFDFFDAMHGWLLTDTGYYATHRNQRDIYATSDGGLHWNHLASGSARGASALGTVAIDCVQTGMTFSSITTGWLTWDCSSGNGPNPPSKGGPFIAVTRDGGRTWAAVTLPGNPAECGAAPPIFSAKAGLMLVSCGGPGAYAYRTADAGLTWTAGLQQLVAPVDFVNGTSGFYFTFDQKQKVYTLYATTSGGADWSVVKSGLFSGRSVNDFQFIDGTTGYADLSNSPVAWVTNDGGKTWSLPPPYRSVGNEICTQPSDPGGGASPRGVQMFTTTTGWAAGARRTTDGGAGWTNVSPPSVKLRSSAYAEFFLDADHAWVVQAAGSAAACADRVVVFNTADGGGTWQHGAPLLHALPSGWAASVAFLDPSNGWLLVGTVLYRSSDAGHTWTQVADMALTLKNCYSSGPMAFATTTTGWMQVQCNNSAQNLLVTHDGGASWTGQVMARSSCCATSALPTFFDPNHGMAFDPSGLFVMTSDGGLEWVKHGLPRLTYHYCLGKGGVTQCSNQSIIAVSFINPNQGWALESNDESGAGGPFAISVMRTEDGGKTWSTAKSNLTKINGYPDPSQNSLTFVNARLGFLWLGPRLLTTSDGGRSWTGVKVTYS
ncbi:MAG TPA: hypothetical protein VHW94_07650 [Candidatus Dormibacteraeota bacterium]|nr:hypothetical protein [Candidatus Dormibacteraeota bacterium]